LYSAQSVVDLLHNAHKEFRCPLVPSNGEFEPVRRDAGRVKRGDRLVEVPADDVDASLSREELALEPRQLLARAARARNDPAWRSETAGGGEG
jgi:hypothetical protein